MIEFIDTSLDRSKRSFMEGFCRLLMTSEAGCTGTFYARRCDDWFEAVIPQGK